MIENTTLCCCGSRKTHELCCHPFLSGRLKPNTPEQLMRSRYSAFCLNDMDYLMSTHHFSTQDSNDREMLLKMFQKTQWLGLKILKTDMDPGCREIGYVEFAAFYKTNEPGQIHEKSRFVRENGQWYYIDGILLEPLKFKRNEPCWCKSGKKYKKCHGK
ncbi:YchJ family protein [Desulfobacula phenolica]|uniref:SEC-C motif-containing protein n=1 Tax=Desulfobacula phenolica TaxID=90732 RepID=A0A1H2JET0_9BACT|nr:YchJ family protein [Desulfobacula phenolica]SDU54899.1 SEC-C motif-containing protein [Desulfobacula phenolica]